MYARNMRLRGVRHRVSLPRFSIEQVLVVARLCWLGIDNRR